MPLRILFAGLLCLAVFTVAAQKRPKILGVAHLTVFVSEVEYRALCLP
jgi:hypothetical protein